MLSLDIMTAAAKRHSLAHRVGRIERLAGNSVSVVGLSKYASVGQRVEFASSAETKGEVVAVDSRHTQIMVDGPTSGLRLSQPVILLGDSVVRPDMSWLGRIVDADGHALDDRPLVQGTEARTLMSSPPAAAERRAMGDRIPTGYAIFNTVLPIACGQRVGLFSGSGVGKSTLLAGFAQNIQTDVIVIALVGERGREVNHFVKDVLGNSGLKRSVVVAATSDQSASVRRRAAFSAMAIAEYFRDQGLHVLLMLDSITRLAEAHREIATSSGEAASMRGFPPSMVNLLAGFAERAGPGGEGQGDITAVFTVLVSGSDMEEPVADTLRGLLDGHFVLTRDIAERGRFPAVDILQSVSRCLPEAASSEENKKISLLRAQLSTYEESEILVRSGLYQNGSNPELDIAIASYPAIDAFAGQHADGIDVAFERLSASLFEKREV